MHSMTNTYSKLAILSTAFFFLMTSCISNKKHLAAIQALEQTQKTAIDTLNIQINQQTVITDSLAILLAHARGGNDALLLTQDKLQVRIDELQEQIRSTQNSAQNTTQGLNQTLAQKDQQIAFKEAKIQEIRSMVGETEQKVDQLAREIQSKLAYLNLVVTTKNYRVHVTIPEGNNLEVGDTRVRSSGRALLSNIAQIIQNHPELEVWVIGHSDNKGTRKFSSNWNFSALRAVEVVKVLVEQYQVSPNQIIAAGQAEFSPKASNESRAGQEENRRVEIVFRPRIEYTIRDLKKKI